MRPYPLQDEELVKDFLHLFNQCLIVRVSIVNFHEFLVGEFPVLLHRLNFVFDQLSINFYRAYIRGEYLGKTFCDIGVNTSFRVIMVVLLSLAPLKSAQVSSFENRRARETSWSREYCKFATEDARFVPCFDEPSLAGASVAAGVVVGGKLALAGSAEPE